MKRRATTSLLICEAAGLISLLAPAVPAAAQDVPGIEICTRESRLDRRTGCLQSNVEYLQQVIAKNTLDAQQKLAIAGRDIAALKSDLAAARHDVAALVAQLAELQSRLDQLQKAAPPAASASPAEQPVAAPTRPDAKAPAK
jgi:septal ring factor EnvC (AmiA/AmiB activator)